MLNFPAACTPLQARLEALNRAAFKTASVTGQLVGMALSVTAQTASAISSSMTGGKGISTSEASAEQYHSYYQVPMFVRFSAILIDAQQLGYSHALQLTVNSRCGAHGALYMLAARLVARLKESGMHVPARGPHCCTLRQHSNVTIHELRC